MNVNHCHEIDDASADTIDLLADLIAASRTDEQMVYREAELDELWRWTGTRRNGASAAEAARIDAALAEIHAVHDLIEDPANAAAAAARLRAVAAQAV